ncbi:MAG: DUF1499 domain-containing protein [Kordiimonadaceae bacterium]|mgnify:CR=1 FL=1|jgi:uncharacterized protein (DUF1499 family)|nr:DUF1499 domain-containing protein [Kordiimonadaceae bacterium]MBT6033180.1 DUF1499 domain-containing protein [Kordiimonadaceae bacterium]
MFIGKKKPSQLANIVLALAVLSGISVIIMVMGASMGLWEPIQGFMYSRMYSNNIGYAVTAISVICLIYLFIKKHLMGKKKALISLIIGLAILSPSIYSMIGPKISYPGIHDITTDTVNPPLFITLTDDREGARNTLVYGGPEIAVQQIEAFPDIKPIMSGLSPDDAYAKALAVGEAMGWEIIGADPAVRRFEGTARTPYFKFVDDTVVVVSEAASGSRIDVRSVSRIGRGDIGVNALRVREFISLFNQ